MMGESEVESNLAPAVEDKNIKETIPNENSNENSRHVSPHKQRNESIHEYARRSLLELDKKPKLSSGSGGAASSVSRVGVRSSIRMSKKYQTPTIVNEERSNPGTPSLQSLLTEANRRSSNGASITHMVSESEMNNKTLGTDKAEETLNAPATPATTASSGINGSMRGSSIVNRTMQYAGSDNAKRGLKAPYFTPGGRGSVSGNDGYGVSSGQMMIHTSVFEEMKQHSKQQENANYTLTMKLAEVEKQCLHYKEHIKELGLEVDHMKMSKLKLEDEMEAKLLDYEFQTTQLKSKSNTITRLEEELLQVVARNKKLTADIEQLVLSQEEMKMSANGAAANDDCMFSGADNGRVTQQMQELESLYGTLETHYNKLKAQYSTLHQQNGTYQTQLDDYDRENQILATENESLHQQIQEQKSALQQQKLGVMDTSLKMKYESQISSLQKHVQLLESQKNVGHVNGAALDNLNGASCPGVDAMGNAALQAELQSVRAQCKTITEERDQIVSKMQLDYDVMLKTKEDQFNELSEATNSLYADYAEEVQALKNENKRKISVFFLRKEPERYAVLCKASFYKWKGMSTSYKLQKSQTKVALDAVSTVKSTPLSVPLAPRTPSLGSSDSKPPPPVTNAGAFCTLCGTSEHVISTGFGSDFESGDQVDMSAATIQKDDLLTYLPVAPGTPSALTHAYASDKNKEFVMRDPRIPVSQSRPGLECRETRTNSNASVTSTSSSPLVSNEDSVEDLFWMVVIKFLIWLLLLLGAYYVLETYTEVSNVSPNSSVPNRFYNLVLNACNRRCYMESDVGQDDCVMNYLTGSDYQVHADSGLDEMRFCTSFSGLSSVAVTILHMLQMVAIECFNMFALGKAMLKGNSMTILGNQTVSMYLSTSLKTVGSTLVEMAHLVGVCLATLLLDLLCSAHHYVLTYYRVTS